jgi:hypothetical protein
MERSATSSVSSVDSPVFNGGKLVRSESLSRIAAVFDKIRITGNFLCPFQH